jgi:hypothetical protein
MTEIVSNKPLLQKLTKLRTELVELAFTMDRRGRPEAADVAMMVSARVEELCEEFERTDLVRPPIEVMRR